MYADVIIIIISAVGCALLNMGLSHRARVNAARIQCKPAALTCHLYILLSCLPLLLSSYMSYAVLVDLRFPSKKLLPLMAITYIEYVVK